MFSKADETMTQLREKTLHIELIIYDWGLLN